MELTFVTTFCALFVISNSIALEDSNLCPDCKCDIKCSSTMQELGERITVLERSMTAAEEKESDAMDQQHQNQSMQIQILAHDQEIRKMEVRLRKLELEISPKTPMLEISGLRTDGIKDNGGTRGGFNATLEDTLQKLSSINQTVDEIESRKIEDLTLMMNELQKKLEEEEQLSRSLKMDLDEIITFIKGQDNLSIEREKMMERLSILSDNINDLDIKYNKSVEVLKQEISSVESKIKHFVSSLKTLHEVQDINLTLSLNQQGVDVFKEDMSNINVTLSSFLQKFGRPGNELQNLTNPERQQLYGNIEATTRFSATPLQSDRNYGPYSFIEYAKNKEAEAYENERQGTDCFLPSSGIWHMKVARVTKSGLMPLKDAHVPSQGISSGTKLRFGCPNFGDMVAMNLENYEQMKSNFTLQCVNGQWKGGEFPQCHLAQERYEDKINEFSKELYYQYMYTSRCDFSSKNATDEFDCARYYLCVDGKVERFECKNPLVFNMASGFCESPFNVDCQAQRHAYDNGINSLEEIGNVYNHMNIYYTEAQMKRLSSLLPRIEVKSDMADKANSLLANGPIGELVAYPQSTVTLDCMFPLRIRSSQDLIWVAKYFNSSYHRKLWNIRTTWNKRSLRLDSLTENDSGIYTCIGPNGRQNELQLIVRAITCPSFSTGSTNKIEITYKPHPRIKSLAMTTEVFFKCPDGYEEVRVKKAICTVYGYWSEEMHMDPLPRLDICQKSRTSGKEHENLQGQSDGCLPFDKILNRDVIIDPPTNKTLYDVGDSIRFQCKNSQILIGSNSLSCETGGHWSSATPPRCVSL